MTTKVIRCRFCGVSSDLDPDMAIALMSKCNNCRIDIYLQGEWTGVGWKIGETIKARLLQKALDA